MSQDFQTAVLMELTEAQSVISNAVAVLEAIEPLIDDDKNVLKVTTTHLKKKMMAYQRDATARARSFGFPNEG